jgi:hypothetical protein
VGGVYRLLHRTFGIEIEFTGITREKAAAVAAEFLQSEAVRTGGYYDTWAVAEQTDNGKVWEFVSDASINAQRKVRGTVVTEGEKYQVELVSPILRYHEDMQTLQGLVRRLRKAGAFAGEGTKCGIHVHVSGDGHTPRSIRNFVNIIASKNDLLYKALQIGEERANYCRKIDARLVERMNRRRPRTMREIEELWYMDYGHYDRQRRYHDSRYHFLNLHSFFNGNGTIELRGFNSGGGSRGDSLHAGAIRAYVVLALALNHQALIQKSASPRKVQEENEKFAMRTYLNRLGLIGDEFKSCREHLCKHLSGNGAWRYRP